MNTYNESHLSTLVRHMVEKDQLPSRLFCYMSVQYLDRLESIFTNNQLWFSAPKDFNDPFDCRVYPEIPNEEDFAHYLSQNSPNATPEQYNGILEGIKRSGSSEAIAKKAIDDVMNRCGIKCFTDNNKNILMWSHYGDSHKEICLEFDVLEDLPFFTYPIKVNYTTEYYHLDFRNPKFVTELLRSKSVDWSYENEVRIYKKESGQHKFNPSSLKTITFGCCASDDSMNAIKDLVQANPLLNHVICLKASTNDKEYKLDIQNVQNE